MKNAKRILCLAAALLFALSAASCNFTTAKMDSAIITDASGNAVESYDTNAKTFYAEANIKNAPDRTKVTIVWTYVDGNQIIDQMNVYSEEDTTVVTSYLQAETSYPMGNYKVEFFVEDRKDPDTSVAFTVTKASDTAIENAHMTSAIDEDGVPVDTITEVAPSGTWYVAAELRNTQPDTQIRFVWYDSTGGTIDSYTLDPEGKSDVYINGSLELTQIAPEGTYKVEMFIDDSTEPAASVSFEVKTLVASNADLGEFTTYTQYEGNFSVQYPSAWTMIENTDKQLAIFYPEEYEIQEESDLNDVVVSRNEGIAEGYTMSSLLDKWASLMEEENYTDYQELERTVDTLNGREVGVFLFSNTRGEYSLYTVNFFFIEGNDLYEIHMVATEEVAEILLPYLEQIVSSFTIL